jgi:hypothetical protein
VLKRAAQGLKGTSRVLVRIQESEFGVAAISLRLEGASANAARQFQVAAEHSISAQILLDELWDIFHGPFKYESSSINLFSQ